MTDTTERPPAREVLARHLAELDGEDPDQTTHQGQPNWERFYAMTADAHLKALAAAGYPVEAGPALVEALDQLLTAVQTAEETRYQGPEEERQLVQARRDGEIALALAKQEPKP